MLPVHRLGDCDSGHDCFPPQVLVTASINTKANGKGIGRIGDIYSSHCCKSCHSGNVATGSIGVFINGRNAAHIGSLVSCGGVAVCCSPNVDV